MVSLRNCTTPRSPTCVMDAVSPSESAALGGHRAMTPIIAGSVCGAVLVIAWIAGLVVYLVKRHRKRKRRAAGLEEPGEKLPSRPSEKVIIPPDPAIVGENNWIGVEPDNTKHKNGKCNAGAHVTGNRGESRQKSPTRLQIPELSRA